MTEQNEMSTFFLLSRPRKVTLNGKQFRFNLILHFAVESDTNYVDALGLQGVKKAFVPISPTMKRFHIDFLIINHCQRLDLIYCEIAD